MDEFKFIMFFVWAAAMGLACWSFEVARMFARRMSKEALRRAVPDSTTDPVPPWPQVAVILPIKGGGNDHEETLQNLRALCAQQYPRYRLLFAVESADDPILPLLASLSRENQPSGTQPFQIDTVVAGLATLRGQKVHNQLAAIDQTTAADEILVFMDADAHPTPGWLMALVRPLLEPRLGAKTDVVASTGFRFYVPRHPRRHLADAMVSVINAAVAALLGPGWRNIAWGGSMAIRRDDFFGPAGGNVHEAWRHALSDDYVLSWCVRNRAQRRIQFVQGCLVASTADFSWPSFWEFAARQYRITKVCAPAVWLAAIGAALLYLVGLAYPLIFFLLSLTGIVPAHSLTGSVDYFLLVMFLALYLANVMRGWFLLQGGLAALPGHARNLRGISFWYIWGYPLNFVFNLAALFKSALGRTITWRGVRYRMKNRLETLVERPPRLTQPRPAIEQSPRLNSPSLEPGATQS